MAKKFVSVTTLEAFMGILKDELGAKVNVADVISTLEGYNPETDAEKIVTAAVVAGLKNELDNQDFSTFIKNENVISDLSNITADAVQVVAASVIKALSDKIDAIDADGDGKADSAADADKLGGQDPSYYATAEALTNGLDGVVKVGEDGKVPSDVLPSYVDDVIEGYLDAENNAFYEDEAKATAIDPEKGKIYVDLGSPTNQCYRWSGTAFIEVSSNDMVEITEDEVQNLWDSITVTAE